MNTTTARPLLGCIADDFTGATDLANMLVRGGMRTVQSIGRARRHHGHFTGSRLGRATGNRRIQIQ